MIKQETPIVSTLSNMISSFMMMFIGIITGVIVTRALGPEYKGEYANLRLISSLYAPFLIFGYHGGILYYGVRKELRLQSFFWTGWLLISLMSIIIVTILFPVAQLGYLGTIASEVSDFHIFLGLVPIPFILLNVYSERVIRSYNLFRASNIRQVVGGIVTLVYYLILLTFFEIDLEHALWGITLGQAVQLAMNLYFVIKYVKVSWSLDLNQPFKPFRYGIQNWLNQILNTSNDKLDQIILTFLLSAGSFGIYTTGIGLSNLLTKLPSSYVNVFYNQIASREPKAALVLYAKAQRITFLVTLIMSLLLSITAYPAIYLMYGEAFLPAALVVILYTPGLIFQVAARLSVKFFAAQGRPLKNSLIYIAGLIVSLPFYFLLIPRYGINGAAIASSIAYMSAFLFSFYQIHSEYGLKLREVLRFQKEDIRFIGLQFGKIPMVKKIFKVGNEKQ